MKLFVFLPALISCWSAAVSAAPVFLDSPEGRQLIERAAPKVDFWALSSTFVTQRTQTLCSVASSVTVLNALPISKPGDPVLYPYRFFTQENFFSAAVSRHVSLARVLEDGMTLTQITEALRINGVAVSKVHAGETDVGTFRSRLIENLGDDRDFMIVNFLRSVVGQKGEGHFSPLAAYDEETDRVLLMDVARYKYPPSWLEVERLFEAMTGTDPASGETRGWAEISAPQ